MGIHCTITNKGDLTGDEVLMVYHRISNKIQTGYPVPKKALVDFARTRIAPGTTATMSFMIPNEKLGVTNMQGDKVVPAGTHYYDITNGIASAQTFEVNVSTSLTLDVVP